MAAGRPATVLAASEAPRLAPGQVATGYDALILEVHDIGPGRLRGGWGSPLLRGHGGYLCADRR